MRPTPRRSSVSSKIRPSAAVSRAPARTLSQIGVSRPSENRTGCVLLASGPGPPSARPVCMLKVRQDECQDFARWYPDFCFRTIRKEKRSMHTRRSFLKGAVAATAAVAAGPTILVRDARAAGQLKILQWSHFVPAYDKWFDPWAKEWGSKHGVDVTVDHVGFADVVPRATAEVAAQSGHDIHMFLGLASAFEEHVIDLADVVRTIEQKHGPAVDLVKRSTYNPFTKKQFALSDMWVPDPGNYVRPVWTEIGMASGPSTWEDLVKAAPEIKKKHPEIQIPIGIGLSQDIDSNMAVRNILWCHGGSIQDNHGNVVLASPETLRALEYAKRLYTVGMNPAVLSWNAASNNQAFNAKQTAYILNSISAYRTVQDNKLPIADQAFFVPAVKGP